MNRDTLRLEENPRPRGVEKMETKERLYRVYVGPGIIYQKELPSHSQIRNEVLLVLVVKVGD